MIQNNHEKELLLVIPHIETKFGTVAVLNFHEDIPEGWERLQMNEGRTILKQLKNLTTVWSIIAFQFGAFTGSGYHYEIKQSYGMECGEGFILKRKLK